MVVRTTEYKDLKCQKTREQTLLVNTHTKKKKHTHTQLDKTTSGFMPLTASLAALVAALVAALG